MLTLVAVRVLPSFLEEMSLLTLLPSTPTSARLCVGAIWLLKPSLNSPGT